MLGMRIAEMIIQEFMNLFSSDFSIVAGQCQHFMPCSFNRTGFMYVNMAGVSSYDTLMRSEGCGNHRHICLCAAYQELNLSILTFAKDSDDAPGAHAMRIHTMAHSLLKIGLD